MDALSSGGLQQTGKDAVGFQSAFRSSSEAYLAEDHQMPERLFRVIVGGWYAGAPEKGKKKSLIGTCQSNSLVPILPAGHRGISLNCYRAQLEPFLYLR